MIFGYTVGDTLCLKIADASKEKKIFSQVEWGKIIKSETSYPNFCTYEPSQEDFFNFQRSVEPKFWKQVPVKTLSCVEIKPGGQVVYCTDSEPQKNKLFYKTNSISFS